MKKYIIQALILWGAIGLCYFLFIYKGVSSNGRIAQYQATIDSLTLEIGKKDITIASLDSTRSVLDSLVVLDKAKLAETAQKAAAYREKYNEELSHINDMSDDAVISEFTAAFN